MTERHLPDTEPRQWHVLARGRPDRTPDSAVRYPVTRGNRLITDEDVGAGGAS